MPLTLDFSNFFYYCTRGELWKSEARYLHFQNIRPLTVVDHIHFLSSYLPCVWVWDLLHLLPENHQKWQQSYFINWNPEITLDLWVRIPPSLISLDAVTYIPKRITSDSFQKPLGLIHFGHICNDFRALTFRTSSSSVVKLMMLI